MEVVSKIDQENQAKIWKQIFGFAESLVLKCAVQLEIAETLHNNVKPMSLSELASKLPAQPVNEDRLYRILHFLVHMKLFNKDATTQKYSLAPPAKYLLKGWEKSMVPSILSVTDKDFTAPWNHLGDGLTGNCNAFEKALGKGIRVYMRENPEKDQLFNEGMACDTRLFASALVNECKSIFSDGINTLAGVGRGTGTAVKAISKAFPDIKCTIHDLPEVTSKNSKIPRDVFKSVPSADAIFMKSILHEWNDEECIQILKRCKEAIPKGGKVIIADVVIDMDSTHPYSKSRLAMDLAMMLHTGGKERTEEDWKKLIDAAGFASCKITKLSALQSVIEAYPH
ncbi:hypothetical protein C5167_047519 [Papaver somniferum]|uniref:Scoulerine-9-O-methyltransferase 3 n=2 Tax=Papaver somniferum TaxID=3469 RepID=SOMT3_PAPSO|nr:probable scoulerine-9-O-methyltransferase OMT3B [Papaver somniferum]I3PLQ7.1 RecName: Full=Scoulerine-9-O-methyltransferase 3; Short=PsSOMT3; AltName: Full=O-methyltransferase 3 [Papaver somniferum]AFB74613.1 O-methyltransferase 3 [Papaver somniferum]AFK73711.1 O-methyltransferase [Papaver somniferum]AWJ64118.1 4'-O-Desmethyl-3-O-acetylpapaveroxine O-methyltransferase subunit [Papaver somniferum]QBG82622.1 OMT3 [Papaver somniferum]RZC84734.1 hypothetical protein C5167_047519 [Papaver somni